MQGVLHKAAVVKESFSVEISEGEVIISYKLDLFFQFRPGCVTIQIMQLNNHFEHTVCVCVGESARLGPDMFQQRIYKCRFTY